MKLQIKDKKYKRKSFIDIVFVILLVSVVGLWSFIIGQMSVNVTEYNSLQDVHYSYSDITINQDGSYYGTTTGGIKVTGCVEGAICG